jgi:hypothetical protein
MFTSGWGTIIQYPELAKKNQGIVHSQIPKKPSKFSMKFC